MRLTSFTFCVIRIHIADDNPKPQIMEHPKKLVALKGDNIVQVCRASSSSPNPMKFQWKKDNVDLNVTGVLEYARTIDDTWTEQTSELQLSNITHKEAGRYQCVVSNAYGTTYSLKSKITVLSKYIFRTIMCMP
jgi:hypothetical protein